MRKLPQIAPIIYHDSDKFVTLRCFADTFVYLKRNNKRTLVALRFGGYPEQVHGMNDAIYSGGTIETSIEGHRIVIDSLVRQYRRKLTHDGIYAEATIIAADDE